MLDDLFNRLGTLAFVALLLSALVEAVLSVTWNKMYFMFGLPIFVKKIAVKNHRAEIPLKHIFETRFDSDGWMPIDFKKIGPNMYGFREESFLTFKLSYIPVMRGLLVFDDVNHQVAVKGFVNWSMLAISLTWLSIVVAGLFANLLIMFLFLFLLIFLFIVIVVVGYAIQYSRFSQVAEVAERAWQHH